MVDPMTCTATQLLPIGCILVSTIASERQHDKEAPRCSRMRASEQGLR